MLVCLEGNVVQKEKQSWDIIHGFDVPVVCRAKVNPDRTHQSDGDSVAPKDGRPLKLRTSYTYLGEVGKAMSKTDYQ